VAVRDEDGLHLTGTTTAQPVFMLGHADGGPGYTSAAFTAPDRGRSVAVIAGPSATVDPTEPALRLLCLDQ
jgi:hypothetical protein